MGNILEVGRQRERVRIPLSPYRGEGLMESRLLWEQEYCEFDSRRPDSSNFSFGFQSVQEFWGFILKCRNEMRFEAIFFFGRRICFLD